MKAGLISTFVVEACEAAEKGHPFDLSDVCKIGDKILHILHPEMNHEVTEGAMTSYPEASQELFNKYLDEVECALESVGLIYELSNCAWTIDMQGKHT